MRLNRYLAEAGLCSRRKADEIIQSGRVKVNGLPVAELGVQVEPGEDRIQVDGRTLEPPARKTVLLLNKPKGVICTVDDPQGRRTVMDLVELDVRVVPVGRLDAESTGALLLTNDGDLTHLLLHPSSHVPKEYVVLPDRELSEAEVAKLAGGIKLDDGRTQPCVVERMGRPGSRPRYRIVLTEGRNRQIRRMLEALGAHVERLHRRSIAGLSVEDLEPGQWRVLVGKEVDRLRKAARRAAENKGDGELGEDWVAPRRPLPESFEGRAAASRPGTKPPRKGRFEDSPRGSKPARDGKPGAQPPRAGRFEDSPRGSKPARDGKPGAQPPRPGRFEDSPRGSKPARDGKPGAQPPRPGRFEDSPRGSKPARDGKPGAQPPRAGRFEDSPRGSKPTREGKPGAQPPHPGRFEDAPRTSKPADKRHTRQGTTRSGRPGEERPRAPKPSPSGPGGILPGGKHLRTPRRKGGK